MSSKNRLKKGSVSNESEDDEKLKSSGDDKPKDHGKNRNGPVYDMFSLTSEYMIEEEDPLKELSSRRDDFDGVSGRNSIPLELEKTLGSIITNINELDISKFENDSTEKENISCDNSVSNEKTIEILKEKLRTKENMYQTVKESLERYREKYGREITEVTKMKQKMMESAELFKKETHTFKSCIIKTKESIESLRKDNELLSKEKTVLLNRIEHIKKNAKEKFLKMDDIVQSLQKQIENHSKTKSILSKLDSENESLKKKNETQQKRISDLETKLKSQSLENEEIIKILTENNQNMKKIVSIQTKENDELLKRIDTIKTNAKNKIIQLMRDTKTLTKEKDESGKINESLKSEFGTLKMKYEGEECNFESKNLSNLRFEEQLDELNQKNMERMKKYEEFHRKKVETKRKEFKRIYELVLMKKGQIDQNTCPICLERPRNSTISCGHLFCGECLRKLKKPICPNCRASFKDIIKLYK